jgi:hypothetical protein
MLMCNPSTCPAGANAAVAVGIWLLFVPGGWVGGGGLSFPLPLLLLPLLLLPLLLLPLLLLPLLLLPLLLLLLLLLSSCCC